MPARDAVLGHSFLVLGPESLLAERAVADLRERALTEVPDAQVNVVQAADLNPGSLIEMTGGSLFSSASVAVVEDLANLPAELVDAVAGLAADTPDDVCLILVHGGGVKGKGLLDRLRKGRCEVVDAAALKPKDLPGFISAEARRAGVRLDALAAQELQACVGNDLRALAAAVAQLASDSDDEVVGVEVVRRYFAGRAEVTSFKVADETMAGRSAAALEKLRWALETGVAPVLLTSALANSLRTLGRYLDAQGRRMGQQEMAQAVGCPPWKLRDLSSQARSWDSARVARGIALVAQADAAVKGAAGSPDFALESLVLALSTNQPRR